MLLVLEPDETQGIGGMVHIGKALESIEGLFVAIERYVDHVIYLLLPVLGAGQQGKQQAGSN